jgi:uncharacterized protein YlxP (DUF503 family)
MVVGVLRLSLIIHSSFSLKEKRSVLRQIKDRTANKFNVSIAEVDDLDLHNSAVLGLAVVSNDRRHINSILDNIQKFIEELYVAEIVGSDMEILNY